MKIYANTRICELNSMPIKRKKVIVGMSGGLDSTMTAALLKKEGYEVEGIFLEFWKNKNSEEGYESARKMAEILGIQLHKVNAEEDFKKKIIDEFIREYESGRTPNPCVICNPRMKFKVLMDEMRKINADFMATGHYARLRRETPNTKYQILNKAKYSKSKSTIHLMKAEDKTKDQSYFLYGLNQKQLEKIIFPLGDYLKSRVREIAREMNLPVADREESQDVCFVSQDNFGNFLKKYIKNIPGKICDMSGKELGKHEGLHFYTIGQRKGINLGGEGPYYVIKKNISKNMLIVSNKEDLLVDEFKVNEVNWISTDIEFSLKAEIKVRYHSNPVCGTIMEVKSSKFKVKSAGKNYRIKLDEPQEAITPGQSAVFYRGDEVLGGGIITG
jgi:tRNA-specific 2-thiouridylase